MQRTAQQDRSFHGPNTVHRSWQCDIRSELQQYRPKRCPGGWLPGHYSRPHSQHGLHEFYSINHFNFFFESRQIGFAKKSIGLWLLELEWAQNFRASSFIGLCESGSGRARVGLGSGLGQARVSQMSLQARRAS